MSNRRKTPRVILYTGKGGTGKSVVSCATGLKAAMMGYKTIVISADPAHTFSDAFDKPVGSEPTSIEKNLWAVQVDSIREMNKGYIAIQEYIAAVFAARGIDETLAYEMATLPTMTQLFAFLKIEEMAKEEVYDTIILDTVPSGEALRYLAFPKLFGKISRKFVKMVAPLVGIGKALEPLVGVPTPGRKVVDSEVRFIERMDTVGSFLTDPEVTSVRLVANPDSFSIRNMKRTLMTSSLYGANVDMVIINKILPPEVEDPYLAEWKILQEQSLKDAETSFYPLPIKKIRLYDSELKGLKMLEQCGQDLFGEEDPAKVFYKGTPFKVETSKDRCEITVQVPFTEKDQFDIERIGEEVVLKVSTEIGETVNIIPLPTVTLGMHMTKAKLLNNRLHILFTKNGE
ncbi:MAG: TRC40/GET3/ArsA family transport-energizing ATPase [Nitrososphaerales archaeon]